MNTSKKQVNLTDNAVSHSANPGQTKFSSPGLLPVGKKFNLTWNGLSYFPISNPLDSKLFNRLKAVTLAVKAWLAAIPSVISFTKSTLGSST